MGLTADDALLAARELGLTPVADERNPNLWHAMCPLCILSTEKPRLTITESTRGKPARLACSNGCDAAEILRRFTAAVSPQPSARIVSVTAADITIEETSWLESGRVPLGEITILGGAPGRGKTQHAIGLCACGTRGTLEGDLAGEPIPVAFVSGEDSIERTLVPRFLAAGGDPTRAHFFKVKAIEGLEDDPVLELPDDTALIASWLASTGARLLVLDPIIAMIPAALSGHKDQHVRRALAPLARMAHEHDVAVIALMHLTKDREADALNRLNGSVAFGAAARSVLLLAEDPDDPEGENGNRRILAHVKSNLGPKQPSVSYTVSSRVIDGLEGPVATSVLVREGESTYTANDLLDKTASSTEANARDEARAFLEAELADGPVATNKIKADAEDAGISFRTIERAKKALGLRATKTPNGWQWEPRAYASPPGGLGDLGGLPLSKDANTANIATANGSQNGDLDPDAELARLTAKGLT
ncbi:MAG TPA: AAA family ATPase [Solirubrobacteraceae bacterium]|nr:AAA family ATPase [Solirubrobacteraceae bacterium]